MVNIVICLISNLFRIYLIHLFIEVFLGKNQKNKKAVFGVLLLFWIINSMFFLFFHRAWINVLTNFFGISTVVYLYNKSIKTNIFITLSIYLILAACDILSTLCFIHYQDGKMHNQVFAVLSVFLVYICYLLCRKIIKKEEAECTQNFALILVPFFSVLLILVLIYSGMATDTGIVMVSGGLLVINFLMLYLYNLLLRSVLLQHELQMWKQQTIAYSNQMEILTQSNEKVAELKHDMKHHLNEIMLMAKSEKYEEIQNYVKKMNDSMGRTEDLISSGNEEVDSVLNFMIHKAKKTLKEVDVKIRIPEKMQHLYDINIILGNLLENAIEAAEQTEEKILKARIEYQRGIIKIEIENSFLPKKINGRREKGKTIFLTHKKERDKHGFGLKSVEKIVEANNGTMELREENDFFVTKVLLYIPE